MQKIRTFKRFDSNFFPNLSNVLNILLTSLFFANLSNVLNILLTSLAYYILVNTYTGKAFWSHTDKGSYKSFNLQHLLDALEFILNNTYIKFGQQLFLQTKGIPMGGNASPLIADLYLSWLEYQYLSKLVRNKDFNLLHKLKYNSRYIDDIITPNVENFLEIAKHIYPIELPLEQTNNDSLHDTFLDLDITVVNKRFCFKVFHKVDLFNFEVISFPFLESNIPQYICYNTFFSQLVRFSTICSNTSGFAERVHIIYQKLLKRNYDKKKLEKTFNKFTCHYSENLIKYDIPIQKLWQVCLNYNSVTPPSIINKVSFADSNSIFQTNNYIPLRLPISLTNLGNTCYLNSVLQILFQVNTVVPFDIWINHLLLVDKIQCTNSLPLLAFYKFLYLCKLSTISKGELADFVYLLKSINPFFDYKTQRDAHEALILLLDIFSNICNLPLGDGKMSTVPEFVDSFFSGIYKTSFICQLCQETNIYYEPFHHITVQPNTDMFSYLAKDFRENKNLTCRKCTIQSSQSLCTSYQEMPNMLLIQVNRFSVSSLHGRPRKNNHPFGIYENIKLGLINYTLLGLIEHHGVFIDSGHYVSYIRQSNKWYHCDDKHITETNLLALSNNVYLMFYAKEVDLGT